jgi:predicted DNA-binding protein
VSKGTLARVAREVSTGKAKAAFTLRLDTDRHLRLRLASAVTNRSAQQLVTEALDAFLESLTDVDTLATQLSTRGGRTAS